MGVIFPNFVIDMLASGPQAFKEFIVTPVFIVELVDTIGISDFPDFAGSVDASGNFAIAGPL
jgi:hypothetical protein